MKRPSCKPWCGKSYQDPGVPVLMLGRGEPPYPSYFAWTAGAAPAEVWCTPLCCAERRPPNEDPIHPQRQLMTPQQAREAMGLSGNAGLTEPWRSDEITEAPPTPEDPEPIHGWFGLSYAAYLTIPRSVLQSMPADWQRRFVACLEQIDETIDWHPGPSERYVVTLRERGRMTGDRFADYERGRRRVPHRTKP